MGAMQAVATAGAVPFVDIAGRRRVLGVSVLVCSVSLASLAAIYYFSEEKPLASDDEVTSMTTADKTTEVSTATARELDNAVTFLLKAIFVAGFSAGLGPVPWILGAELTPLRGTGLEFGTVCAANWAGSFVTANFFVTTGTTKALAMSLFLYSGITLTCGLLIVANLPETMNMSIEEILMHTDGEQAVKGKKKKTREARGAPAQEQLAIKKEGAASTSVPPPPIEQGLPADGQTVSNAPEKQIAAEVEPQPQCSGTRSPSIASRRSMASKASHASRQSERADMKYYQ